MRFVSTNGTAPTCDLRTALLEGLASDGGLFLPADLSPLPQATLAALPGRGLHAVAAAVWRHLLGASVDDARLNELIREAVTFDTPLVPLDEHVSVLELFHGPTLAFKDVGARFLSALLTGVRQPTDPPLTVITATSGDTGGAVAHAFADRPRTRVVILFPQNQVSPVQRKQFTTVGGNVLAVAVAGTFDDCQTLAKRALLDNELREHVQLSSANSVNVGRLLPQMLYYAHAWAQYSAQEIPLVSVPSGNFGNLTAGLMAKRLGVPIAHFIAATNANAVVPKWLTTGEYVPQTSVRTISSAMDVGDPSNVPRIRALYGDDLTHLRAHVSGSTHSDADTREAMADVYRRFDYVLDPHSAVGYLGLMNGLRGAAAGKGIFLATAHPAKFPDIVASAIGRPVRTPERLAATLERDEHVIRIAADLPVLKRLLLTTGGR